MLLAKRLLLMGVGLVVVLSLLSALSMLSTSAADPPIIYVNGAATGAKDGSSWENGYVDLQEALDSATSGEEVWVVSGTYLPTRRTDPTDPRTATFQMKQGVSIYGGFDGTEITLEDRDWSGNKTILSGDLGELDDVSDNAYHVF